METMVISSTSWSGLKNASICALIFDLRVFTNVVSSDPVGRVEGIVTPSESGLMVHVTVVVLVTIGSGGQVPSIVQALLQIPGFKLGAYIF